MTTEQPSWAWSEAPTYSADVQRVQARLRALGYAPGEIDGFAGLRTRHAINAFRDTNRLAGTDGAWYPSYDTALATAARVTSLARQTATPVALAAQGNAFVRSLLFVRRTLASVAVMLGFGQTVSLPDTTSLPAFVRVFREAAAEASAAAGWMLSSPWAIAALVGFALLMTEAPLRRYMHAYRMGDEQGPYREIK